MPEKGFADYAKQFSSPSLLMPTPNYLHARQAFGIWSLPDRTTPFRTRVEDRLDAYIDFYQKAIEQNKWYGFWNYGDVMHAYDPVRHTGVTMSEDLPGTIRNWLLICGYGIISSVPGVLIFGVWQKL